MHHSITFVAAVGLTALLLSGCSASEPSPAEESTAVEATESATTRPVAPGVESRRFEYAGADEAYYLVLPADRSVTSPVPLIIFLHGAGSTAAQVVVTTDFAAAAEEQGCAFVFPETSNTTAIGVLLDRLTEELLIDPSRIFAQGASAGGPLAARLACEQSDRIAAVGSGAGFDLPSPIVCERPGRPVPLTSFIDPDDGFFALADVREAHARWAAWNGCDAVAAETSVSADVDVIRWVNCAADATVELYLLRELGHRWPADECLSGAPTGTCVERDDFDGGAVQWAFFTEHPMR